MDITYFFNYFAAIGEPDNIDWYNPQGEKIVSSQRVVVQKEGVRSRLIIYNADIEDAGIYRCQATDAKGQTQEATVVLEIYRKYSNIKGNTKEYDLRATGFEKAKPVKILFQALEYLPNNCISCSLVHSHEEGFIILQITVHLLKYFLLYLKYFLFVS